MIKYFCDLCGEESDGSDWQQYAVHVANKADGARYELVNHVCRGCAEIIMDTISKLRVEES